MDDAVVAAADVWADDYVVAVAVAVVEGCAGKTGRFAVHYKIFKHHVIRRDRDRERERERERVR